MNARINIVFLVLCTCLFLFPPEAAAVQAAPKITDREIIESLMRLEAGIQANAVAIKANAEAIKANAEAIKANAEAIGVNREMIGSLRNELQSGIADLRNAMKSEIASLRTEIMGFLLWGFGLLFTGMLILVGFILWDRRSTIKPVKDEIDDLKERKVDKIIVALKKLSEDDTRFAQVLRSVGLL